MKPSMHPSTLLPAGTARSRTAAFLVASSLVLGGAFALTAGSQDDAAQEDAGKKVAQEKEKASQDKGGTPAIGRGRRSGKGDAPAPTVVPRVVPKPAPVASGTDGLTSEEILIKQKEAASVASQGKTARAAAPIAPRNDNAKLEIEFGTDIQDFGKVRQGDQLTHTFKMKSAGTEPLVITQASPTCGCTVGEVRILAEGATTPELYTFGDPIEPGAEVQIESVLDSSSKRNDTQVRIMVYSNDGKTPQHSLTLKANIEPFIVTSPPYVQLGNIQQGTEKVARVTFRTTGGERVMLSEDPNRQIAIPEGLSVEVLPINPDEEGKSSQWQATFTVGADAPEQPGAYLLRLNADVELPVQDKKAEALVAAGKEIPKQYYNCDANVSYNVIGALAVTPEYLSMGLVRPGQPLVRSTRLTAYQPDIDLSNVTARVEGQNGAPLPWADSFSVSVKPVSGSQAVDIDVRLDGLPETADGAFRGIVVIETGHSVKPRLEVTFSGVCRKLAGTGVARPDAPVKSDGSVPDATRQRLEELKKKEMLEREKAKQKEGAAKPDGK